MTLREEIHQQPQAIARLIEHAPAFGRIAARLRADQLDHVLIAARGTSDHAAIYAQYLFGIHLGMPVGLATPSILSVYGAELRLARTLVIGISQSGASPDIVGVLEEGRRRGVPTVAITNDPASVLAGVADEVIDLGVGPELAVAATKTYTAELLVLYLLALALKGEESLGNEVRGLPELSREVLEASWEGTERYRYAEYMVVTSRGYNLATAEEAALKLMETTYVVAQAFSAADLRHGPMAMIGQDFPVVVIAPPGKVQQDLRSLVGSLKDRGAEFVAISDDRSILDRASAKFDVQVRCPDELSPILYAVPIQLFAENLAHLKGLNPDSPRGLSKVTETW
jgi:glucosamine--fructose-6-phosphate aminotransferase (isomerizing)